MGGSPNPNAWRNWYHVVGSTYGTWIRGDPRGFRTFRHRQHVEGDYRRPPPPGVYTPLLETTRRAMRFPPVNLTARQRRILLDGLLTALHQGGVEVVALAVASQHFHLLARFPPLDGDTADQYDRCLLHDGRDPSPRHWVGLARKHASELLHAVGLKPPGPVWAARPRCVPVRDRAHQVNTARYIVQHRAQGAEVAYLPFRNPQP